MSDLNELYDYQNDLGPLGDLAREMIGIKNDYESGAITFQEKEELMYEVLEIKAANMLANQEIALHWVYRIGSTLAKLA